MVNRAPVKIQKLLETMERLGDEPLARRRLSAIADGLLEVLGAERVFVFRFREVGGIRVLAARNLDGEDIQRPQYRLSYHAVRKMERTRGAWFVPDARLDRRYRSEDVVAGGRPPLSILLFPLRDRGESIGGVYADHRFRSLRASSAEEPEVRAWVSLCAMAMTLCDQSARLRALERRVARGERARRAASVLSPAASARRSAPGPEIRSAERVRFGGFSSSNPDLLDLCEDLESLAEANIPILISGETGVGKSLLARAIHESSSRAGGPFVTLEGGAIAEPLVESELFGHRRGAFTGAERDHDGLFVQAHGGTLFLDGVEELSSAVQTKLLRAIEDGSVRPLGAREPVAVDVRIVASTSTSLDSLVGEGAFRGDLYYRLRGFEATIAPLRQRREDIGLLAEIFLARHGPAPGTPRLLAEARGILTRYWWPGNARELENEMRRLAALGIVEIGAGRLSERLRRAATEAGREGPETPGLDDVVARAESRAISEALCRCAGNKSRAARELGITRKALYRRLRKYDLEAGGAPAGARGGGD